MDFVFKEKYDVNDVLNILRILRSENGCPWDKVQTHKSIRDNFIEETYEAIDAIDKEDFDLLREELGDVLMQVVFHSQISEDEGKFNFDDVCDELVHKLIDRHPHVFDNVVANDANEALNSWDNAKMQLKNQKSFSESVDDVPKSLPSLVRSQKVQKRAAKSGFDFKNVNQTLDKIIEEVNEIKDSIANNDKDNQYEEIGDLLFSVVNTARFLGVNSEHALYDATDKFANRFREVEKLSKERNIDLKTGDESLINSLWEEVK